MIKVLLVFSAAFLVAGMVLGFMTNRHRVEGAPRLPTFNPKYWVPWAIPDLLTKKGMKLYLTSFSFIMMGLGLYGIWRVFF